MCGVCLAVPAEIPNGPFPSFYGPCENTQESHRIASHRLIVMRRTKLLDKARTLQQRPVSINVCDDRQWRTTKLSDAARCTATSVNLLPWRALRYKRNRFVRSVLFLSILQLKLLLFRILSNIQIVSSVKCVTAAAAATC